MITGSQDPFLHHQSNHLAVTKPSELTKTSPITTIGELQGYDVTVSVHDSTHSVVVRFNANPDLPAVIFQDGPNHGILCRKELFQTLSRPFGNELFLHRPLTKLLQSLAVPGLKLNADMRIEEAITLALKRPPNSIYDPIMVSINNNRYKVIDFHVLLMAQTQLLEQANRFIRQQVNTGQSLSSLQNIDDVLQQILYELSEMVAFHFGTILLLDTKNRSNYPATSATTWTPSNACCDPIYNSQLFTDLLATRQPRIVYGSQASSAGWIRSEDYPIDSWLGYPLVYSDHVIGILSLTRLARPTSHQKQPYYSSLPAYPPFATGDIDLIQSLSTTFTAAIRNVQLLSELHILAETDPLTNSLNRRGFFEQAEKWFMGAGNTNEFSLLILDIDHFKQVNDRYGHQIGDIVIQKIAAEGQRQLRQTDLFGRFGGEEFIALLPETDQTGAQFVAERIRSAIADLLINVGLQTIQVTISIGVTTFFPKSQSLDSTVRQADSSLYQAKANGRNCIHLWSSNQNQIEGTAEDQNPNHLRGSFLTDPADNQSVINITSFLRKEDLENESVYGLVHALELREKEDRGHAQRVADLTLRFARFVGIPDDQKGAIFRGALLHDIGKIAIPDQILFKPGKLSADEWETMRRHPAYAYQIISTFSYLKDALDIPYCHHEKWNGTGYPRGLKGNEIPLAARMFTIIDVWVALTTNRCYRNAWPVEQVINHIQDQSGREFDPELVEIFLENLSELIRESEQGQKNSPAKALTNH